MEFDVTLNSSLAAPTSVALPSLRMMFDSLLNEGSSWPLEDIIKAVASPKITEKPDWTSSLYGSWFLSPRQHAIEFILCNAIFPAGLHFFMKRAIGKGSAGRRLFLSHSVSDIAPFLERFFNISITISYALMFIHKYINAKLTFIIQPCHVSAVLLLILLNWPRNSKSIVPHIIFNVTLHTMWGTVLALVFPDLRDIKLPLEAFNFFWEHILLLAVPIYFIYSRRFVVLPFSLSFCASAFILKAIYHSAVLTIVALYTGFNLNYMLAPPVGPLIWFGSHYRVVMYIFCFVLSLACRLGIAVFTREFNSVPFWPKKTSSALRSVRNEVVTKNQVDVEKKFKAL